MFCSAKGLCPGGKAAVGGFSEHTDEAVQSGCVPGSGLRWVLVHLSFMWGNLTTVLDEQPTGDLLLASMEECLGRAALSFPTEILLLLS